ncbi:MAG TPA: Gmad2 immunoglobulin-like domain-containing protein [Acidimicrobiales bacterium]|nr:Gmad2 immunoglobulin-like domain-containing protein [Acidimicrobiales bacterium]
MALVLGFTVAAGCSSSARNTPQPTTTSSAAANPTANPTTSAPPASSTTSPASAPVALYLLRGNYLGVARRTVGPVSTIGTAAVNALLGGPDASERAAGLSSAVPPGSKLLGLAVSSGTATAHFDAAFGTPGPAPSELQRVAEVVYTLTQFPTVQLVSFSVDGNGLTAVDLSRPLGRSDLRAALPAILVENPAVGDALAGTLRLAGMANVFEAQFRAQLTDASGHVLVDQPVHATAGTGTWGSFDATFSLHVTTPTACLLRVYAVSAKDGSPIDEVDLHLTAKP